MSSPVVTILVPSYNHGQFVEAALDSLLNQTFTDYEVKIIDDASTDDTVERIRPYLKDPRFSLTVRPKNLGGSYATHDAVLNARGKYFCTLSSDDVYRADKLEKQVEILETSGNLGAVFARARFMDERGAPLQRPDPFHAFGYSSDQWLNHFFYDCNCICHPAGLIRTDVFAEFCLPELFLSSLGDFDMWIRLVQAREIKVLSDELITFRVLDGERNASGDNAANRQAVLNEWKWILRRFLAVCNESRFPQVFPNVILNAKGKNDYEFLLAIEAVKKTSVPHKAFGIELLYEIFADHMRAQFIAEHHGIGPSDLISLSQKTDTFQNELVVAGRDAIQKKAQLSAQLEDIQYRHFQLMSSRAVQAALKVSQVKRWALGRFQ